MPQRVTITRPDDMHLHFRDGAKMASVVGLTARQFPRGIVMPNLAPVPVTTVTHAREYRDRILFAVSQTPYSFEPLMTLYLTDVTSPDEIDHAKSCGFVHGVKLYPAGATTNSHGGVTDIKKVWPVLERMEKLGMPLLIHGEVTDPTVDIFDREKVFIDKVLVPHIVSKFPALKIVLEHLTTAYGVFYVKSASSNIAATITPQHLLGNRNDMLVGGIKPHWYCLPILKRGKDQKTLVAAAVSGNPKFFLGTDSAPHATHTKEAECGCAGSFTAPHALELYAEVFDSAGELHNLESFASHSGADFYDLPRNTGTVTLERADWTLPDSYPFDEKDTIKPLRVRADGSMKWKMVS